MKYKELKQHVAKLEELTQTEIQLPTKAEWKALSQEEQNTSLIDLINQSLILMTELDEQMEEPIYDDEPTPDPDGPGDAPEPVHAIDSILAERGSNYGKFSNHAHLAQTLKSVFDSHVRQYGQPELFTDAMNEAIEMIFHKLARIGNGNPTYVDNFIDICGYSQLVVDELQKGESR